MNAESTQVSNMAEPHILSTRKLDNAYDYTMMSTFQRCQRKFYYSHKLGLKPKEPSLAPTFGAAIHTGLDVWYNEPVKDADTVNKTVEVFKEAYKEHENLEIDKKRTLVMGEWILRNYHDKYRDQPWKVLASEKVFDIKMQKGYVFMGRIDKIIEWNGAVWVVDHKTTSQLGAQYFRMIEPSLQFPGYVWAAQELGYKAVGVIVDAILVAKGLLESSSRARLVPLARYDAFVHDWQLDEWRRTVLAVQQAIRSRDYEERESAWTPNFDACVYYGECPFRKVCTESPEVRTRILATEYRKEFWDPRNVR